MAFNIQGGVHCCALEHDWTSLLCFCEDDGSIAIVGTRSLSGPLHLQVDASLIIGREVFGMVWDIYSGGSSWLLSLMPLVLLDCGHVACKTKQWRCYYHCGLLAAVLSRRLLFVQEHNHRHGRRGRDSKHFAAVIKRRVSGTFQAYTRLLPRCVHLQRVPAIHFEATQRPLHVFPPR